MSFPIERTRRMRQNRMLRAMVRETQVTPSDFMLPLFVIEGRDMQHPIASMPGVFHQTIDRLVGTAREAFSMGIPSVMLFGLPATKDETGSSGTSDDAIVPRAIAAIKEAVPELQVVADICLCEYTSHGHCGVIDPKHGHVHNDKTLPLLAQMSLACARAGVDMVAPSDMMDGRVGALRAALDREGFEQLPIMAYSAKYASGFYGPFREAAQSAPQFGDRSGYQMDPANVREALREVRLDLEEGADLVMVKPALAYLDVIRAVREMSDRPVAAYNVSGEYAMVRAAAANGWLDYNRVMMEVLTSIKRAGADVIITYHAMDAARLLGR